MLKPGLRLMQVFFWTFWKKLKLEKTQNSSKIHKNSSKNSKKTQKPPTSLKFSWRKIFKHHNFWPQLHYLIFNIWPTNLNRKTNISFLLQWLTLPSNFWSDFITALITVNWKEKLKGILVKKLKTQAKFRKKLKPKSKKTQKPPTPVEMSCQKNVQKNPDLGLRAFNSLVWRKTENSGNSTKLRTSAPHTWPPTSLNKIPPNPT